MSVPKLKNAEIIFHFPCNDGLTAAAIAKLYAIHHGFAYNFHPMKAGETPKLVLNLENTNIIFLDCSPTAEEVELLSKNKNLVTVIDHHKTAVEALLNVKGKFISHFDMLESGASLAYDYFNTDDLYNSLPNLLHFVNLVKAKDSNDNVMKPNSDYLFFALAAKCKEVKNPVDQLDVVIDCIDKLPLLLLEGKLLMHQQEEAILHSVVSGKRVFITDIYSPLIATEVGEKVMEKFPEIDYVMMKYEGLDQNGIGVTNVSLRSKKEDVGEVAKKEGGGGHKFSAGYFYQTKKHKI